MIRRWVLIRSCGKIFTGDVVEHLQGQNITVFFSSHLLYEVEPVADIVGILDKGVIVREAGTEELRNTVKRLTYSRESSALVERAMSRATKILDIHEESRQISITVEDSAAARGFADGRNCESES